MKRKTIKKILLKKFNDWAESIEDKEVRSLVEKNSIITGGCITSMLMQEDVNDYDVYFTNKETVMAVAEYYANKWNSSDHGSRAYVIEADAFYSDDIAPGDELSEVNDMCQSVDKDRVKIFIRSTGIANDTGTDIEASPEEIYDLEDNVTETDTSEGKYRIQFMSSNAITLSHKIQLIIRFYGTPEEVHANFDFIHATSYWLSDTGELHLNKPALASILERTLYYHGSRYPICSVIRLRKFIKRGWSVSGGEILKMCMQISELDLTDIEVLEDQLFGVDSAYFAMLIDALRVKKEGDTDFVPTTPYVISLVDRIFGE